MDIDRGELELPEELPYFPYEKELEEELRYAGLQDCSLVWWINFFPFFSIQTLLIYTRSTSRPRFFTNS